MWSLFTGRQKALHVQLNSTRAPSSSANEILVFHYVNAVSLRFCSISRESRRTPDETVGLQHISLFSQRRSKRSTHSALRLVVAPDGARLTRDEGARQADAAGRVRRRYLGGGGQ
eukprot:224893-Prymnesium_polylepis.1